MSNTKEIVTPSGHKVLLKEFLSYNDLEPTLKIEDTYEKSAKTIEIAIVSVNGVTEDAYKTLRALPFPDYKVVTEEVAKLINGNFTPAK